MLTIDPRSPVPIYDQIKAGLKGLVATGALRPGDPAPSIRGLAVTLKVNPNTVARAFRELTIEGFFESRRGDGNVIAAGALKQAKSGLEDQRDGFEESVRLARRGGLPWGEIDKAVRAVKEEER
jgi:GntR family transcriptional regulator